MADSQSLGDLLVRIGGNVDGLQDAAKKGVAALEQLNIGSNKMGAGMALAIGGAVGIVVQLAKTIEQSLSGIIGRFVELGKSAQSLGIPVEQLSKFQFAAKKAGVTQEELTSGFERFARNAGQIRSAIEPADNFQQALQAIGISFQTMQSANPTELLLQLADRFSKMEDGVKKSRIAFEIFGRGFAEWVPFLNQGRTAIESNMEALNKLGGVIGRETTGEALKFQQSMASLNGTFDSIVKRLANDFMPILSSIAQSLTGAIKTTDNMSYATEGLRIVFLGLVNALTVVGTGLKVVMETVGTFLSAVSKAVRGDFAGAFQVIKDGFNSVVDDVKGGGRAIADQWKSAGYFADQWKTTVVKAEKDIKDQIKVREKTSTQAAEEFAKSRKLEIEAIIASATMTTTAVQQIERAFARGKISISEYDSAIEKAIGLNRQAELVKLSEVMDRVLSTPAQKITALQAALKNGTLHWSVYGQNVRAIEEQNRQNMLDTATTAASTITAMFENNKAASIASAIINTGVGITKALAVQGPWGWAQAALIAAAGAAQVAKISSTSMDGGGSAGAAASVSSSSGESAAASQPGPNSGQTMFVKGMSRGEIFGGDSIRSIIQGIIDFQKDGGTVFLRGK